MENSDVTRMLGLGFSQCYQSDMQSARRMTTCTYMQGSYLVR